MVINITHFINFDSFLTIVIKSKYIFELMFGIQRPKSLIIWTKYHIFVLFLGILAAVIKSKYIFNFTLVLGDSKTPTKRIKKIKQLPINGLWGLYKDGKKN